MNLNMQAIADEIRDSGNAVPGDPDGAAGEENANADVETAAANEEAVTPGGDREVSESSESDRKPGVDEVLQALEESHGPQYAEVLRGYQRNNSHLARERTEVDDMRQKMRDGLDELEQLRGNITAQAPEPDQEEDAELSKIPQEQQVLLDRWLKANGYVSQEQLSQREQQQALSELTQDANSRGVESWGDEFGHFDAEGKFLVNPEARDKMAPIFDRLVNQKGLTFEDMYVISNYDGLIEQAKEVGRREAQNAANTRETERSTRLNNARVAGRSATGASEPVIYDRDNEQGDIGAVFRRLRGLV